MTALSEAFTDVLAAIGREYFAYSNRTMQGAECIGVKLKRINDTTDLIVAAIDHIDANTDETGTYKGYPARDLTVAFRKYSLDLVSRGYVAHWRSVPALYACLGEEA